MMSLTEARELAARAYAGWAGWHHSRHWRATDYVEGMQQLRREAVAEVEGMGVKWREIRERERLTRELVDRIDNAIADYNVEEVS